MRVLVKPLRRRDTPYAKEIKSASVGDARIERIYVKSEKQDEIRISWWPKGKFARAALDVPEDTFVKLIARGVEQNVLSEEFITKLMGILDRRRR